VNSISLASPSEFRSTLGCMPLRAKAEPTCSQVIPKCSPSSPKGACAIAGEFILKAAMMNAANALKMGFTWNIILALM
jgi:hypothetical protein